MIRYSEDGPGRRSHAAPVFAVPNATGHLSVTSVPIIMITLHAVAINVPLPYLRVGIHMLRSIQVVNSCSRVHDR